MKEYQKAIVAVLLILAIAFGAFGAYMGSWNPKDWTSNNGGNGNNIQTGQTLQNMQLTIDDSGHQVLDPAAAAITDNTNYYISYWAFRGGSYMLLGNGASGTCTIETTPQDNGVIYIAVTPRSAQAYYVDVAGTKANNPRIVGDAQYFDINKDGYKEFVFQFSTTGIQTPIGALPVVYFYPYFHAYLTMTINSPADITSIGTSATTQYLQWYTTFASTKKACALYEVEIQLNTTDLTQVTLNNINIPGVGVLTGDDLGQPFRGASTLTWTWKASPANLAGADYLTYGTNQLDKFDFTASIGTTLTAGAKIGVTINLYTVDQAGAAVAVITDTVGLAA